MLCHPTDNPLVTEKLSINKHQISLTGFAERGPKTRASECFVICSFFQGMRYRMVNYWQRQFKDGKILPGNYHTPYFLLCD